MFQSQLFTILQTFTQTEWKEFRDYIITQTREQSEPVTIFDYIAAHKEDLQHPKLELEKQ